MQGPSSVNPPNAPAPVSHGDVARPSNPNTSNFSKVCTLLLQSQQHYCVQDAATFSRLLCVSQQLLEALLPAAVGCLKARITRYHGCSCSSSTHCMISWLCKHLDLGTLRCLEVEASDFQPGIHEALAQQLAAVPRSKQMAAGAVGHSTGPLRKVMALLATAAPWAEPACSVMGAAAAAADAAATDAPLVLPKHTVIKISWHVCGLPPCSLSEIPGARLTHLTLRDLRLSPVTLQHLPRLTMLQQLHLPNVNPEPASLAPALAALTALTQLFIRDPCAAVQQALPVSLQQLTVAQRTPPWVAAPALQPLRLTHLTALSSLTVQEWFARGVTEDYTLPSNLCQLAVPCLSSAAPLLALKQLRQLQLSSLKHSSPQQLLQLRSLPAITAVQLSSEAPPASARLLPADLRAYGQVFAALPVHITALTVQLQLQTQPEGMMEAGTACPDSLRALAALTTLRGLSIEAGGHIDRLPAVMAVGFGPHHSGNAISPVQLAEALARLTALTMLRLCHVRLGPTRVTPSTNHSSSSSSSTSQTAAGDNSTASSSSSSADNSLLVGEGHSLNHAAVPCCAAMSEQRVVAAAAPASCDVIAGDGWMLVMQAVASLPKLCKLICRGLDLGSAAGCLTAAKKLAHLELHDCGVTPSVVQRLVEGLASSSVGSSSTAATVTASHMDDPDSGGNGESSLAANSGPCPAAGAVPGAVAVGNNCLTCLKFSSCL